MEKSNKGLVIWIVVFIVAVIMICTGAFLYFTQDNNIIENNEENNKVNNNEEISISNEPIYTLENFPKVDASLATQPLTDAILANFVGIEKENVRSYTDYTNTHPGYIRLIDGEVDLIVVTQPSEDELAYAKQKGVELEVIPVVYDAFVFMVNEENPVNNLSIEQIQNIYQRKITNWSEVGGANEKILAFQRPNNSGSQTGMLNLVMKDLEIMEPLTEEFAIEMGDLVDAIADYDNAKNSLGYSYYYYAKTMYTYDNIKFLSINGVVPSYDNIKSGAYPLKTAYNIVINKNEPEDGEVRKLIKDMLSPRGQQVAKEAGYVPVN